MTIIIIIVAALVLLVSGGVLLFILFKGDDVDTDALMGHAGKGIGAEALRQKLAEDDKGEELAALKGKMQKSIKHRSKITLEDKFFQAGLFHQKDREFFRKFRIISPIVSVLIVGGAMLFLGMGPDILVVSIIFGVLIGLQVPFSWLNRKIIRRSEDILFYLPLVIEQIVVGVSASLDIAPCMSVVTEMADERGSHNPVTELLKRTQFFMKQGVPMEEALTEIGKMSGHTELKHAFMSLAQVARHGGEVTKQLQELADSVATQREIKIDAKIKKLELQATGPVALVFSAFLIIILLEFGLQVLKAF
ncbi:MAG: type II secretion system F family protein [SAR324 cluster bacterium]|uniref:Type II secretion system F family protein n=1 Tax=SAR324 cluster bacterium TaxID=2024889 RepID=A0A7X9FSM2_9DELT|nr:type II secretion system F family protein [SAR324 cluster bacterium]